MLNQDTDETLDGTEYHAVDHDRAVLLAVCSHVLQFKTLGQLEVQLNGSALPGTANAVYQMEINLRAIERAVALIYYIRHTQLVQSVSKACCSHLPVLITSHGILGTGGLHGT